MLDVVTVRGPLSITTLAEHLQQDDGNVRRDVAALLELNLLAQEDAGLVSAPWDAVEVHLAFHSADVAA